MKQLACHLGYYRKLVLPPFMFFIKSSGFLFRRIAFVSAQCWSAIMTVIAVPASGIIDENVCQLEFRSLSGRLKETKHSLNLS